MITGLVDEQAGKLEEPIGLHIRTTLVNPASLKQEGGVDLEAVEISSVPLRMPSMLGGELVPTHCTQTQW